MLKFRRKKGVFTSEEVNIRLVNGQEIFTGINVPISFLSKSLKVSPQFIRIAMQRKIGQFAELGIVMKNEFRNYYYISDKSVFDTFGIKYFED